MILDYGGFLRPRLKDGKKYWLWDKSQTIEYCLDDMIQSKKKEVDLIFYSFTPSDLNFKTIYDAQSDLGKKCHRKGGHLEPFLYLVCFTLETEIKISS